MPKMQGLEGGRSEIPVDLRVAVAAPGVRQEIRDLRASRRHAIRSAGRMRCGASRFILGTVTRAATAGLLALLVVATVQAQKSPAAATAPPTLAEAPKDTLGRTTPRGTVQGFLGAARKGENDLARQYLNSQLTGEAAEELAHQLFVVLNTRLEDVSRVSDTPEGSFPNSAPPVLEVIGTIRSAGGDLEVVLEQQATADGAAIWLFSRGTLEWVPDVYGEITLTRNTTFLPAFLTTMRAGGIRLVEWAVMLLALGALYPATVLLNRVLTALARKIRPEGFKRSNVSAHGMVPAPARVLLLAVMGRALLDALPFSLVARQFWSNIFALISIFSIAWLLILLSTEVERIIVRRVPVASAPAVTSLLRLGRRGFEVVVAFAALIATLRHFGIDPTPALAGLGVGGIAVALAAQKTLENVIAGASLIFDQAVRVGDVLKMETTVGTVEHIGLRSTRIRTVERTLVSVPNSQLANTTLETISARDRFWFHPMLTLRYETTTEQLQTVLRDVNELLSNQPEVDRTTVRVRLLQLNTFSLDVEVFAYILARDWAHFLEIQEKLLFSITSIVERAGTSFAFPSQTMYMVQETPTPTPKSAQAPVPETRG